MPIIESGYTCKRIFRNGHIQTILPYFYRKEINITNKITEVIHTDDGDELTSYKFNSNSETRKLAIITHGLEGNGNDPYYVEFAKHLNNENYDCVTWTMRTCNGVIKKTSKFYNACDYCDLELIISHFEKDYDEIYLVGVSLGGSITANYLGREGDKIHSKIKASTIISTPVDLHSSSASLGKFLSRKLYSPRFVSSIKKKILEKSKEVDLGLDLSKVKSAKVIKDIDEHVVGPIYNFTGAYDYYEKGSSLPYIKNIECPLLIINALDDPFLGKECFPFKEAKDHKLLFLEAPKHGGHVGFILSKGDKMYWYEKRAIEFFANH